MARKKPTNPNGANQYLLDPRQNLCWSYYTDPSSKETFGNAYRSALKAGFEEGTAKQITVSTWFMEKTRRMNLLSKAEKVLEETLVMPHEIPVIERVYSKKRGELHRIAKDPKTGEILKTIDTGILKVKQDSAKFVAETQGKNDGYSKRSEVTGKDGDPLFDHDAKAKGDNAVKEFLGGNTGAGK